jgi:hypothetical protein
MVLFLKTCPFFKEIWQIVITKVLNSGLSMQFRFRQKPSKMALIINQECSVSLIIFYFFG